MTKEFKKSIIEFTKKKLGRDDLDLRVELTDDKRPYLVLTVDCMKMDKNGGQFDKSYYDFVTNAHREKPKGLFLDFGSNVLSPVLDDFQKFMNIKIEPWFSYKNYDYIDDIENKIEEAVKKSSHPDIEINFRGRGDNPKLSLSFYNVSSEMMNNTGNINKGGNTNRNNGVFDDYIEELNQLTGLDLNQYSISRTMGDKK
jgi:hypothetical protein